MSSYLVLARKWRPAQFKDIVGQAHIVRTLVNAIRSQRIHQAYLFTGSRGIGKTSIARIFAKVIRCEHTQEKDNLLFSCDQCPSCKEITASSSVDVIEIDGASNNGVEAVREIRESSKYMPSSGSRKIYIIDEVHMLSTAAFNALLKTLEEPPAHVIFIFATTEPHKIPATILSRCQRFDYRRVSIHQILGRLTEITQAEGIEAHPTALSLIARSADGGMRDALSLLDQVIAFSGTQVSIQDVRDSIGLIEGQVLLGILQGIFNKKPNDALQLVDQIYQQGQDLRLLTRGLIEFLHASLLTKIGSSRTQELSEEEWKELTEISKARTIEEIELIFQVLHQGLEWISHSPQPKVILDILVIKCATAEALIYLNQEEPENREKPENLPPQQTQQKTEQSPKAPLAPLKLPQAAPPSEQPLVSRPVHQKDEKSWEGFVEFVRKPRPLLASILEHCSDVKLPSEKDPHSLFLAFSSKEAYFREQIQSRVYQEQLSQLAREHFGTPIRFQIDIKDSSGESLVARREREHKERLLRIRDGAQNHPIILEAKSLFGGELGPIHVTEFKNADSV